VGVLICGGVIWKALSPTPTPHSEPIPRPAPIAEITPAPSFKSDGTPSPGPIAYITPAPASPSLLPVPTPSGRPGVDNWVPNFTPGPAAGPLVDPKLIGTWSTKMTTPGGFVTLKWEQLEDGRYTLVRAGTAIDSGTLSAQGGKLHIVTVAHGTADAVYNFKTTAKLETTGMSDPGLVIWTRSSSGTTSSKSGNTTSHSKGSGGESSSSHSGSSDWQKYIPRNVPSHFPRPF
jgi:hypothetical protein